MKRLYWTIGLAILGLYLGWNSQPYPKANSGFGDVAAIMFPVLGLGAVGFGFGTIFVRPRPGTGLVIAWTVTLALLSTIFGFGMIFPIKSFAAAEVLGGSLAAMAGAVIGLFHGWHIQRKSNLPGPNATS